MTKKYFITLLLICNLHILFAGKVDRAFRHLEKQNFDKAKELLDEASIELSNSVTVEYGLSLIYYHLESPFHDIRSAYIHIKHANEIYPNISNEEYELMTDNKVSIDDIQELKNKVEVSLLSPYLKKGTVTALNFYIKKYEDAGNIEEAIKWKNKLAFEEAQREGTAKAYDAFINKYPQAEQVAIAERQRSKLAYIELLEKEKELDKVIKEKIDAENSALKKTTEDQKNRIALLVAVITVVVLLLGMSIFSFLKIRQANIEIKEQKETIEEKNNQIMDSIKYAKFIQEAILPKTTILKEYFEDAFVFYRPKDIVSGDFYWFAETNDKIMVAAVDCTGHGVPGAFMSMIGHTLLNQIVHIKGILKPSEILFELRREVIKSLNQRADDNYGRDGMDMALISFDKNSYTLEFSGAYNPLYIVKNDKLIQVKADRQPISIHFSKTDKPFTNHSMNLEKGDRLYIFSDGYADQFGGEKDKKYSYKRLRNDLIAMGSLKGEEQKNALTKNIDDWMGDKKPIDDMLVIGLKV